MEIGMLMETFCPEPGPWYVDDSPNAYRTREPQARRNTRTSDLCLQNGRVLKWFGGTALCVLVTYSTFRFVKSKM